MKPAKLMSWSIRQLHSHLIEKRFAIPKLQRNFVWDGTHSYCLDLGPYSQKPESGLQLH